ncbi:transcription elongation factor GreA [Mesorhizobium australicum]|uniref:Transcription elongation factor, GreA/GreB family n=1 Tax=Mesorhizobium australicum TaxID=536018 RepID=A0A1X7NW41_9HYPH|nr:transcription elongation factor GreA [Mesorhizobium australicum]SMH41983.1 Transcription elongation factor, GreA/GreB family [Mesorhizobium australicum]
MSRAFTKEDDDTEAIAMIGERPVSAERNLVTAEGLRQIEAEMARLRDELSQAEKSQERVAVATILRDLRYWTSRRETAELSEPEAGSDVVRFGMTVVLEGEDGKRRTWRIVGEDEADAAKGSISHVSPMARALFGKRVGDVVTVAGKEWEVVGL